MSTASTLLAKPILPILDIQRDECGYWDHPDIPWHLLPEDADSRPWLLELGFESHFDGLCLEDSAVSDAYFESDDPDCSAWNPQPPDGEGWFLASIYDTEDGPYACWIKPVTAAS